MILCFIRGFPFAEKSPSVTAFAPPSPGKSTITPSISVEETGVQRWENGSVGAGLFSYLVYLSLLGTYVSVWESEGKTEQW